MDKETVSMLFEVISDINETVKRMKDSPLLITKSDLDILEYNINIIQDYIKAYERN